ncbi:MerR family transcriptional regulator [Rhizobium grahamii]|uniref:MerR family transcriptional regulator n=1 Tax=Rhizobium grahamii TaxID=1120045 RepID=A0A5Q0CC88_9HYPH|nr:MULTISPECIES: MerR family transcriptional regulator [Rhizobium]QFY61349.1 MerR family transcriptional regulator [Rhizobium grahamii]QRM49502.1 MerR family transcriptional regulator [Rhizobium sp. BG6]
MSEQGNDNRWLTAAECAEQMGLTVRALRLYETRRLISPRRTGKNWRLYGMSDIARLHEILALKRLGLSLAHITDLLAGHAVDLDRTLAMQEAAMMALRGRADEGLALIQASRRRIALGEPVAIHDIIRIARETNMSDNNSDAVAWRRYEQARPRVEVPTDPALHPRYVGCYRFATGAVMTISVRPGGLSAQLTGQDSLEIFAEKDDLFFYRVVPAQLSFTGDDGGLARSLILHQNGYEQTAFRIDEARARAIAAELEDRIKDKRPVPDSEARLRGLIREAIQGEYDFNQMTEGLATATREQAPKIKADLEKAGALKGHVFKGVTSEGWDVYDVTFENENLEWRFVLADDGRMSGAWIRPLP